MQDMRHASNYIEPLDARRYLSAEFATINPGGVLSIVGTGNNDRITAGLVGDDIHVTRKLLSADRKTVLAKETLVFSSDAVVQVDVHAGDGNDFIHIEPGPIPLAIAGEEGADIIIGSDGPESIVGGRGNDLIDSGYGNDTVRGGGGRDYIIGNVGADRIYGNAGDDTLEGSAGNDTIYGGSGNDSLNGGGNNDRLYAESGNDQLFDGSGKDYADGADGDDHFFEQYNRTDTLVGGPGNDIVTPLMDKQVFIDIEQRESA